MELNQTKDTYDTYETERFVAFRDFFRIYLCKNTGFKICCFCLHNFLVAALVYDGGVDAAGHVALESGKSVTSPGRPCAIAVCAPV